MLPKLDIKEKHFHGILIVGGMAGLLEGMMRDGFTLHTMFPGMMLTLVAAFLGGFSGFFIKDLTRTWRGMAPYRGVNNDGWIMGAFMGTFLGTLYQIIDSANGANLVVGAMFGAYFGAMCGAFPDEFITPILRLMHAEQAARKLTESEQQISSRS